MDFVCLQRGIEEVSGQVAAIEKNDVMGLVLAGVLFAVPLAPVVLLLYQRRVQKLMLRSTPETRLISAHADAQRSVAAASRNETSCAPTGETLVQASDARARALWKVLALSVALYSVGTALAITISPDSPGELSRRPLWEWFAGAFGYLLFVGSLSAPLVLLGVASSRFAGLFWKRFAPLYIVVVVIATFFNDDMPEAERLETFVQGLGILIVFYAGLGGRRMRNVVPTFSVLLCLLVGAVIVLGAGYTTIQPCVDENSLVASLLICLLILAGLWAAWRAVLYAVGFLAGAYERKAFSDAQYQIGAWMAVITMLFAMAPGYTELGLNLWSLGVIPPLFGSLWLYRTLLKRIEPWRPPRSLLLLRVFNRDKRGERLLDEVAFRWRFIGPIHMISGPDLAKTNLEPHELLLFLRRRLGELFVTGPSSLERRLAEMDMGPDPDARYRINEFFCFDNIWQEAVAALLQRSDTILLDLRGFSGTRRGTAFEIKLLAERDALKQSVILIDDQTDMEAVERAIAETPGAVLPQGRVLRTGGPVAGEEVFGLLVRGVQGEAKMPMGAG